MCYITFIADHDHSTALTSRVIKIIIMFQSTAKKLLIIGSLDFFRVDQIRKKISGIRLGDRSGITRSLNLVL